MSSAYANPVPGQKLLAYWRFEQVQHLNGELSQSIKGNPLTADDRKPTEPQPFVYDDSGNGNFLQVRGSKSSPNVFSDDVPSSETAGKPNQRSLTLKWTGECVLTMDRPLAYADIQKSWKIEASLLCNQLALEQVFICKEGLKGNLAADVSIGYDPMLKRYFVEVMCADGKARRVPAGSAVMAGKWYDICADAVYDEEHDLTTLKISVKASGAKNFEKPATIVVKGITMQHHAAMWVVGHGYPGGFPNSLQVDGGGIDEVKIWGEALPRKVGQNPLFTDAFTADPTALVCGDSVYAYVGHDAASVGGWFNMPEWLCYSSTDMKHWKAHGSILKAQDFVNANSTAAWAAQVVKKGNKYYFYVTLDGKKGHFITVAVGNSPTGPFKEAMPGKPLITDDMTNDSHRPNADIDPTVLIDDDGTPWMFWGNGDCYMVKLNQNMVELDGPITKIPFRNYSEGPWVFKRNGLYYNVYAADAPGVQAEQICYSTATKITGPWVYGGLVTGPAKYGFTIHPAVIAFKNKWYFFYHDGSYALDGTPGGDCRRSVCLEYLDFYQNGQIKPVALTVQGINSVKQK
ncbi:family 43 glycosylhydrolase [Mucilaginibacter paludis]|uniref:family 43 glycosylhydrolase n=1 Tax=Mucilaginibacter paludis TaxID=423351 RepID=UPI0012F9DD67|nr:family 43 glycosylhydrolase [Mucilaginibacter paludis]